MLDFSIITEKSLESDLDDLTPQINTAIKAGLKSLNADLKAILQGHILTDVYDTYEPQDYIRRSIVPAYGTPLESEENFSSDIFNNALAFMYTPTGEYYKGATVDSDGVIHRQYGAKNNNDLIRVLEYGKGYSWYVRQQHIPSRPFWSNFLIEVIEGGAADRSLVNGLNNFDSDLKAKTDNNIVRDGNETEF